MELDFALPLVQIIGKKSRRVIIRCEKQRNDDVACTSIFSGRRSRATHYTSRRTLYAFRFVNLPPITTRDERPYILNITRQN